eukprot:Plantae.Rhodophyta-Palmaria_palmata.ctg2045.p1 GENE.Plantae.Rhodophyta-Palmaria_palmata.ctg2045~~Plantae.Rhodophyta-Palmaria_palmata.ctg2045.p1  ORF type:complete len:218 (+),score=52.59 Plantae.Rhodophyta-Palmaria_palmata.ctg2045:49-654(+)
MGEGGGRVGLKKATRGPVNDSAPVSIPKPAATPAKKAVQGGVPKSELVGKKWVIEYQVGSKAEPQIVNVDATMKQTLYAYKCDNALIKVSGKINAIVLDSCSKTACVFEEAMATVEIVNSRDIQIQCTKTSPAVTIDGCTAVTFYMSETFAGCQIITAKSAAVNLIRPTDDDDIIETPIPEQFMTAWKDGSWITEAVSHDD